MVEKSTIALGILIVISISFSAGALYTAYNQTPPEPEKFVQKYCNNSKPCVDFMNKYYVSNSTFKAHNAALLTIFEDLDKKVDGLQGKVTLLQAVGDVTTLPSPTFPTVTSTILLNLELSDNNFQVKPSGYPRDTGAILITGVSEFKDQAYVITIADPAGGFAKDKFGKTLSDGDISEAWVIPQNAIIGKYVVTITINDKSDSIEFTLV